MINESAVLTRDFFSVALLRLRLRLRLIVYKSTVARLLLIRVQVEQRAGRLVCLSRTSILGRRMPDFIVFSALEPALLLVIVLLLILIVIKSFVFRSE